MELAGDERFDEVDFVLGDWAHYLRSSVNAEDIKALVAVMKPACMVRPKVKNATVIRPDASGNALVAFYKMLADDLPWEYDIYHSFDDAYAWFGIPTPDYHKNITLSSKPLAAPSNTHAPVPETKGSQ